MDYEQLDRLIGMLLEALSTNGRRLGLGLPSVRGRTIVDLGGHRTTAQQAGSRALSNVRRHCLEDPAPLHGVQRQR